MAKPHLLMLEALMPIADPQLDHCSPCIACIRPPTRRR